MKYSVGLDLGGTKIAVGLVSAEGRMVFYERFPTPREEDYKSPRQRVRAVVDALADATHRALEKAPRPAQVCGIGVASAGPLNLEKGELVYPANFSGWKKVPLIALLESRLSARKIKLPLRFQNDATAAALAEGWCGAAQDCTTYAAVTIGTGIGTGVILNHRPAQSRGMGSEWGHQIICLERLQSTDDLNFVSVEGVASGTGMLRHARKIGFDGKSVEELVQKVREGHNQYQIVFDDAAKALAVLFYNLSLGFHLERIVISGGLIKIRDLYLEEAIKLYRDWIRRKNPAFLTQIKVAKLANRAGVVGAARLSFPHPEISVGSPRRTR